MTQTCIRPWEQSYAVEYSCIKYADASLSQKAQDMACIMKMTCKCHLVRPQKVLWMRYATEPCSTWWQRQGGICPRLRLGEAGDLREIPWRNQLLGTSISVCVTPLFVLRDRVPSKCSFPYATPCLDFKVTGNRKFSGVPSATPGCFSTSLELLPVSRCFLSAAMVQSVCTVTMVYSLVGKDVSHSSRWPASWQRLWSQRPYRQQPQSAVQSKSKSSF